MYTPSEALWKIKDICTSTPPLAELNADQIYLLDDAINDVIEVVDLTEVNDAG